MEAVVILREQIRVEWEDRGSTIVLMTTLSRPEKATRLDDAVSYLREYRRRLRLYNSMLPYRRDDPLGSYGIIDLERDEFPYMANAPEECQELANRDTEHCYPRSFHQTRVVSAVCEDRNQQLIAGTAVCNHNSLGQEVLRNWLRMKQVCSEGEAVLRPG